MHPEDGQRRLDDNCTVSHVEEESNSGKVADLTFGVICVEARVIALTMLIGGT